MRLHGLSIPTPRLACPACARLPTSDPGRSYSCTWQLLERARRPSACGPRPLAGRGRADRRSRGSGRAGDVADARTHARDGWRRGRLVGVPRGRAQPRDRSRPDGADDLLHGSLRAGVRFRLRRCGAVDALSAVVLGGAGSVRMARAYGDHRRPHHGRGPARHQRGARRRDPLACPRRSDVGRPRSPAPCCSSRSIRGSSPTLSR